RERLRTTKMHGSERLARGMVARNVAAMVEWFVAITAITIGVSHVARPQDWAEAFRQLRRLGRPGAFVNGGLSLGIGAAIVAGDGAWVWPSAVLTSFGWLLVAMGFFCMLAPDKALRSMARGADFPRGFVFAGIASLAIGGWACYCIWYRTR